MQRPRGGVPGVPTRKHRWRFAVLASALPLGWGLVGAVHAGSAGSAAFTKLTGPGQSLTEARRVAVGVTLPSGEVLIAGGNNSGGDLSSAELFSPSTDTFAKLAGAGQALTEARSDAVAASLPSGEVLIAGGEDKSGRLTSAELFNPTTDTFSKLDEKLTEARSGAVAATLPSGEVLIAGGAGPGPGFLSSAELFNPATGTFTQLTGPGQSLTEGRSGAFAVTLASGEVLIAGGGSPLAVPTAELFNPATDTFSKLTGPGQSLAEARADAAAAMLPSGQVLIAGGFSHGYTSSVELFDPSNDTFKKLTGAGEYLTEERSGAVAATLTSGQVLIVGGNSGTSAELYNPGAQSQTATGCEKTGGEQPGATGGARGQTITFTTCPPDPAVAGASYDIAATSSSGQTVQLTYHEPACSFGGPFGPHKPGWETSLAASAGPGYGTLGSPQTVYLTAPGTCTITAQVPGNTDYEAATAQQSFPVTRDPSEKLTFTSSEPRAEAIVGRSYNPSVRSSAGGLLVFFSSSTPSTCKLETQGRSSELKLIAPGMCTVGASNDRQSKTPEATQSFEVFAHAPKHNNTSAESGIPAPVRSELFEEAETMAAGQGDEHPRDIEAVLTTFVRAKGLLDPGGSDNCSETPACQRWPVYAIAMRGDFHFSGPAPPEAEIKESTVLQYTVPASEPPPGEMGRGFGLGHSYPDLGALGVPVHLEETSLIPTKGTGTIVIHVYTVGGPAPPVGCYGTKCPNESALVWIARLGLGGKLTHMRKTKEHTIHVVPGRYEIALSETQLARHEGQRVTVRAGRVSKATLTINVP